MKELRVRIEQVRAYNCAKHGLMDAYKFNGIEESVTNLLGLHSARLSTPFVALIIRGKRFRPSQLIDELYINHKLIKLRCMRKTLHTVTLDLAPIVHQATKSLRITECISFYRKNNLDKRLITQLRENVIKVLIGSSLSSKQIIQKINVAKTVNPNIVRIVIKHLWEEGILCYINNSDTWNKERRVYSITKNRYPYLDLDSISVEDAQDLLIYKHIQCYGPVNEKDISWWSGLPLTVIRRGIRKFQVSISSIYVSGLENTFYISSDDLDDLLDFKFQHNWIKLLAYEDPLLKGYFSSRERYICSDNYDKLFNRIGEARASILKNGVVIGVWEWDKRKQKIKIFPFGPLQKEDISLIEQEVNLIENGLSL